MTQHIHTFTCTICGQVITKISSRKKEYTVRYCKQCLSDVRRRVGMLGALSNNPDRSNDSDVIALVKTTITELYNNNGSIPTLVQTCKEAGMSSKTFSRASKSAGVLYSDILNELRLPESGLSRFQKSVLGIIHEIYPSIEIASEMTFINLLNPTTGCKLRIDIYIESLKLAVECDGVQHSNEDHYYNTLAVQSGYTPSYITDNIKEEYCIRNGIRLVRVPYRRIVTRQYILDCIR